VAALTQGRGRRRWSGQIPGEGWHSEGGGGQKGMVCTGGTGVSEKWAPAGSGRERERRGAGRMGQLRKERGVGRAQRNSNIFDLFK
jgi:hypothetical protein